LSKAFRHSHGQLAHPIVVVGTRVEGNRGLALVGSRVELASALPLRREHGAWKVQAILGISLP
jgi:hypothetical protein